MIMAERKVDCVVDRVEDGVMVLVPDSGDKVIEVPSKLFPVFKENEGCTVFLEGEKIIKIIRREVSTDNKDRLKKLFNKNK